ncbi:hypothetical protein [Phenylobacterium sp.]|uniref:hypothetical protein n=1 Tax=Phenylobacterium sp. TaxID=1871053 RepID=UPI00286A8662|nr:hypothetical protein [Phenylobacterium sp.]
MGWRKTIILAVFMLLAQSPASAQEVCKACTKRLDLDEARWQCLMRQRPVLENESASLVFFQLDPVTCNSTNGKARNTSVVIPVREGKPGDNSPVYVLTKWQVSCLARNARSVRADSGRFVFDFTSRCPPGP